MSQTTPWVDDSNVALFTDLYEITMLQAYFEQHMFDDAAFSLFIRRLPARRNYFLACGIDDVLDYLEHLHFSADSIDYLASLGTFSGEFLTWLADFRFTGHVSAVAEGTPVFGNEPILELVAPLPEAQLIETYVMNQVHLQTLLASKAARVVVAAAGRGVVDFGARRIHGTDAAVKGARAFTIAGIDGTSNVLAGSLYGIPVTGTMAHSFIQAYGNEADAFRAFARIYPETVLLIDTYDTLEGAAKVVSLAAELGDDFRVQAVRLDSGDLAALAGQCRAIFDDAGLTGLKIIASGGLDEYKVAKLVSAGAPIDGFGVGTAMGVSEDTPSLDIAYKLVSYGGHGRLKLAPGKGNPPGRKQVFRIEKDGRAAGDVIARHGEILPGRPLLAPVMKAGKRLAPPRPLAELADYAGAQIAALPDEIRALEAARPPYKVELSEALTSYQAEITREFAG